MSRNHAALHYRGERFFLEDTNSSNGTQVNDQRLQPFQVVLFKSRNDRLGKNSTISSITLQPTEVFSGDVLEFGTEVSALEIEIESDLINES